MDNTDVYALVLRKRLRVIADPSAPAGNGAAATRQFDAVLMCAGFKLSGSLFAALASRDPGYVMDLAVSAIPVVRELAGDHVRHNTYFKDFPEGVPDTEEFWLDCLRDAVMAGAEIGGGVGLVRGRPSVIIDLLSLPKYGRYQHSYEDMLASHDEWLPEVSDRLTVLHLGSLLEVEAGQLADDLAASTVPLSGDDLEALRTLAGLGLVAVEDIPVRENKAVINAARVRSGLPVLADTVTDFLRLAAELSGGDVTLETATQVKSLPRRQRVAIMHGLDQLIAGQGSKLEDVLRYPEQWKRLGERLHPHEYRDRFPQAQKVFQVARGEYPVLTLAGRIELAFAEGNPKAAAGWMSAAPGTLWRGADRVLRAVSPHDLAEVTGYFQKTAPKVSGRVLLSVREHLQNRMSPGTSRIFINRKGRGYAATDTREPLDLWAAQDVLKVIDAEIMRRLPDPGHLVIDPAILGAALPLTGKPTPEGMAVFPRGSVTRVDGGLLRFFIYWRQKDRRTDYDLSTLITDPGYQSFDHLSYTQLRNAAGEHSGDITDAPAPDGASEFINLHLDRVGRGIIIPQVLVYAGESFNEVDESFFGFMTMGEDQRGRPFEPRAVRYRSALYGEGRVAMPLAFYRGEDGHWYAKWLHMYLKGRSNFWGGTNVESNKVTTLGLTRAVMEREQLRVSYLVDMLKAKAKFHTQPWNGEPLDSETPVTYIGAAQPENLPAGSTIITLANLGALIPG